MKYWICKRGAPLAAEALECLGGNGYVEEAPMAQFYRDIQLGTVWEGSGNVIALDVLRALGGSRVPPPPSSRSASSPRAPIAHLDAASGPHGGGARGARGRCRPRPQWAARRLDRGHGARAAGEACCVRHAPADVGRGLLCRAPRRPRGLAFGDLPRGVDGAAILERGPGSIGPLSGRPIRLPRPLSDPRPRTSRSGGSAWPRASARGCAPTSRPRART